VHFPFLFITKQTHYNKMEVASHNKWEDDHSGGGGPGGGNRRPMRMSNREDGGGGGGGGGNIPFSKMIFDGKRMRKAIQRRTVDYNHSVARWMQVRFFLYLNKIQVIFQHVFFLGFLFSWRLFI
jgi:hypothetical protein